MDRREQKRRDVVILLQDYLNFLPTGNQDAFVSIHDAGSGSDSGPLTLESMQRMNKDTLVGETYHKLDLALYKLKTYYPKLHHSLYYIYLVDGVGHSDVDHMRSKGSYLTDVATHDLAVDYLVDSLIDEDLYVRKADRLPQYKKREAIEDKHNELEAIYVRYREEGLGYSDAIANAAIHCDYDGEYARKIISKRNPVIKEKMKSDVSDLIGWIRSMVAGYIKTENGEYSIVDDLVQDAIMAAMVTESSDEQELKNVARDAVIKQLRMYRERGYKVTLWQNEIPEYYT